MSKRVRIVLKKITAKSELVSIDFAVLFDTKVEILVDKVDKRR